MRIPLFAIIIVFVIWLNLKAHLSQRRDEDVKRAFWDRENLANRTRKQPLDALAYITIPGDLLPPDVLQAPFPARDAANRIRSLIEEDAKIVNLTGYTNTDLKMEYGPANLQTLTEFDAHYTTLATSLQEVASALFDAERFAEACRLLEFEMSTGTDISACYRLLIALYRDRLGLTPDETREKISALLPVAKDLRSLSRDGIVRLVEETLQEISSPSSI